MMDDEATEVTSITETQYVYESEDFAFNVSLKVKAVYPECESEFALTENGEDFVHISNVSVAENPLANVKLYPNPTSGQLNIVAVDMTSVSVYDLVGQCVKQATAENGQLTLDMSQLQSGIYFIKVNTANGSAVQRVVKM